MDQVTEQGALDANKEYEVKDKSGKVDGNYKSNRKILLHLELTKVHHIKMVIKYQKVLAWILDGKIWDYEKHRFKDKEGPIEPGPLRNKRNHW